jgi:ATP-dependent DNA helicase 2 subunit 1
LRRRIRSKLFKKRRLGRVLFNLGSDFKVGVGFYCLLNKAKKPYGVYIDARDNKPLKSTIKYTCKDTGADLYQN